MKTIIAGSRTISDLSVINIAVQASGFHISVVVEGEAKGVDSLAKLWAEANGIPVTEFKADWRRFGRGAGPIRNEQMAKFADGLIAIWDGQSPGTKNMIALGEELGLKVFVFKHTPNG